MLDLPLLPDLNILTVTFVGKEHGNWSLARLARGDKELLSINK
jgi:hypothetical protein